MTCPTCGETNGPEDAFCRWCGGVLPERGAPAAPVEPPSPSRGQQPWPAPPRRRWPALPRWSAPPRWRWWVAAAGAVALLTVIAGGLWWWGPTRDRDPVDNVPAAPFGVVPDLPQPPHARWELTAAQVSSSCPTAESAYTTGPARRCRLDLAQWQDSLVLTLSKGRLDRLRVEQVLGVAAGDGTVSWRLDGLNAVCSQPPAAVLVCADSAGSSIWRVDPATGEKLWEHAYPGQVEALHVVGSEAYLLSRAQDGTDVTRITTGGRVAWTVRADRGVSFEPLTDPVAVADGVVHLGPLQTAEGTSWAVRQSDGSAVRTDSSLIGVQNGSTVSRLQSGRLTVDGAPVGLPPGSRVRQSLWLPDAVDAATGWPWLVVDEAGVPAGSTEVHAYDRGDVTAVHWSSAKALPRALCHGTRVMDDGVELSVEGAMSTDHWAVLDSAGTVAVLCDSRRVLAVDGNGISAYDSPPAASGARLRWRVQIPYTTHARASTHGVLVQQLNGRSVALWR